jgi:hypothetical protein
MGMMQETLQTIQRDMEARPVRRGNARAQMEQQGFDLSPVYIAADGIVEDGTQLAIMFVAHDDSPFSTDSSGKYYPLRPPGKVF